jgi:transposase
MAYSLDLRERVLAAIDGGLSRTRAAQQFRVGRATITTWVALRRERGSLAAQFSPGRPRTIGVAEAEALRVQLLAQPDATLPEHVQRWAAHHPEQPVSTATMSRAIQRLGWTRKKSRSVPASKTRRSGPRSRHASKATARRRL